MYLVETLIVMSIAGVAVAGLFKASQQALVTSNMVQTQQVTRDFKNKVYRILNTSCETILATNNRLTNDTKKIKEMTGIFKRPTPDDTAPKINIFEGFIETVDIIIAPTDPNTQTIMTFKLYYKYSDKAKALRDMQTRGGAKCTLNDQEKAGCYHISCNIDVHDPDEPDHPINNPPDKCKPLDCVLDNSASSVLTESCEEGEFLAGPGNCVKCPAGQFLIGVERDDSGTITANCLQANTCGAEEVAVVKKTGATYSMECVDVVCDEGEHITYSSGSVTCKKICHGGQIPINGVCACPENEEMDKQGNCTCGGDESGKKRHPETGACGCPAGMTLQSGVCRCPSGGKNEANKCYCLEFQNPLENDCVCLGGYKDDYEGWCTIGPRP